MIKKHYKLIIFLLIIFTIFMIYKNNHNHYYNYTSLGDGYAKGINSYGIEEYGYSDFIKDSLQKSKKLKLYTKDYTSKDESINNLYDAIATNEKITINHSEKNIKEILRESNLVTITIGLNDLIYHIAITPNLNEYKLNSIMNNIKKELTRLIKEIKTYYPKTIYIIGYPNIPFENIYIKEGLTKLETIYKNMQGIEYISTAKIITNEDFLNPNSIYIRREGYKKIAYEITKKLSITFENVSKNH